GPRRAVWLPRAWPPARGPLTQRQPRTDSGPVTRLSDCWWESYTRGSAIEPLPYNGCPELPHSPQWPPAAPPSESERAARAWAGTAAAARASSSRAPDRKAAY